MEKQEIEISFKTIEVKETGKETLTILKRFEAEVRPYKQKNILYSGLIQAYPAKDFIGKKVLIFILDKDTEIKNPPEKSPKEEIQTTS